MKLLVAILLIFSAHNLYAFDFSKQIVFDYKDTRFIYNKDKTEKTRMPSYQTVNSADQKRCFNLIKNELERYPKEILDAILKKVVILSEITFGKATASGVAYYEEIFIQCHKNRSAYNIQLTLHHELSSLLISSDSNLGFNFDQFLELNISGPDSYLNPENYFGPNASPEVANFLGLIINPKMNSKGFLTDYSHTDIQNDINMIAEYLMVTPKSLNSITSYPTLLNKVNFVRSFYQLLGIQTDDHLMNF